MMDFASESVNMLKTNVKSLLKMTTEIGMFSTNFSLTTLCVGDIIYIIITSEKFACWGRKGSDPPECGCFRVKINGRSLPKYVRRKVMKKSKLFRRSSLILVIIALAVALTVGVIAGVAMLSDEQEQTTAAEYGEHCKNIQVSTSGKVSLKFYYDTYGTAASFVYEVYDQNQALVHTGMYPVDTLENTQYGYCVAVPLAPSEMMYTVKVYPADANGENLGEPQVYSVKEYATEVLADPAFAEYHDAMRALLNWGAMAQNYFNPLQGKPVGTLPNTDLFARGTNSIWSVNSIDYVSGTVQCDGAFDPAASQMTLSLEPGNIAMHFYIVYNGEGTLTATVSKNGGEAVKTDIVETEDGWRVRIANVPANRFDTPYTITVTDGTNTLVVTKSVREYLGIRLAECNKLGNSGLNEGNVIRSAYQLYQLTSGNTGADTCDHGKRALTYWINSDADTQRIRCSLCHADLGHQAIDSGVNEYFPASMLKYATQTGKTTVTLMSEDGVDFARLDDYYANRDNWGDLGLTNELSPNTVTGQYMVIKYRIGTEGNGNVYIEPYTNTNRHVNTTVAETNGTINANKYHGLVGAAGSQLANSKADEWITVIIDLSQRVSNPSLAFLPLDDGSFDVQYFSIRFFPYASTTITSLDDSAPGRYVYTYQDAAGKMYTYYGTKLTDEEMAEKGYTLAKLSKMKISEDAYVDVAYIAFADAMDEVMSLVDTEIYADSVANDKNNYYMTADGSCAHRNRDANEYHEGNTYSYAKCAQCGEYLYSRTLDDSVKVFFSPKMISYTSTADPTNPRVHYNFGTKAFAVDPDEAYFGFVGQDNAAQLIWNRVGFSADQAYTMDIGKAQYVVIKMRLSNTNLSKNWGFNFSTTGADSYTYTALPVATSTAGEWATYVVDLAKVFGSYYAPDAETGNYLVDVFYLHSDKLLKTDKIDIAYIAFVEGDWKEVVDTNTAIVQAARNGAGSVVDIKTGKCVDDNHSLSVHVVDGTYKYACEACGTVIRDYGVTVEDAGAYWPAEELYQRAANGASGSWWQGGMTNKSVVTEDGETFLRLNDGTCSDWGGWFPHDSNNAKTAGRYMVIKVRRNSNISGLTGLGFWITSSAGYTNTWAAGSFTVVLGQDNTWHTIVVDLAERSSAYIADANGNYAPRTVHVRPFGGGKSYNETTDETFDIAYMAFFDDLADIKNIVKDDTYEFSKTDTSSVLLNTQTGACATSCVPTRVTDETDPRGYRYECSVCGKDFSIDFWVQAAKGYSGGTDYASTITDMTDEAGFTYKAIEFTGKNGTMMNFTSGYYGGTNMYSPEIMAGRFLIVKMKGSVPEGGNLPFNVATDDNGMTPANPKQTPIGKFTSTTMPSEWTVVVIDLHNVAGYSDGEKHKIVFSTAVGDGGCATQGVKMDLAYVAIASDLNDVLSFAEGENIMFYGNSVANTPREITGSCEKDGHLFDYSETDVDGVKTITYTCMICGKEEVQTISADINWFASLDEMGNLQHSLTIGLFDSEEVVAFNRYTGTGGNHLNLSAKSSGAGAPTSESFMSGKYVAIKYRATNTTLGLNVATYAPDFVYNDNRGKTAGTQQIANLPGDEWRVAIVDVSGVSGWVSDGSMQRFYLMITTAGSDPYTVDIAWVAVVDSIAEMKTLLREGETYYDYGTSFGSAGKEMNQDGTCVQHICSEAVGTTTVTYTCNHCKTVVKQIKLDDSVTKYYSANQLTTTAKTYYGGSKSYKWDSVHSIAYMDTTVTQVIWQRMDHDVPTGQTASNAEQYSENVGNAKYLVVKARSSDDNAYLRFVISTMAKNCEIRTITEADFKDGVLNATKATYRKIDENGKTDTATCAKVGDQYYFGDAVTSVFLMGKGEATGEWVTYVIDLETVCDGFYEKVEGQDYYDVDAFYFYNAGANQIAYVAFVEGSWAEIDALVEEDVVMQITAQGSTTASVGKLVNVADGSDVQ